jgi:SNW domain-containing protein 1
VVDATLEATRAVIEARVNKTMAANQPKSLPGGPAAPQYIKYTPAKQGPEYNSGASHRIIKMHEVPVDPLQPPKFAHKKVCRWRPTLGAPSHRGLLPQLTRLLRCRCPVVRAARRCR